MPFRRDPLLEKLEPLRRLSASWPLGYGVAVVSVALAIVLQRSFAGPLSSGVFLAFYPAVVVTAAIGRQWPGMVAVVLSVVAADYFFIPPAHAFAVTAGYPIALVFFAFNLTLTVAVISLLHTLLDRMWQQENNLRLVIEAQPAGLIGVDDNGIITLVNATIERQLGYHANELVGRQIECLLPERYRRAHEGHRADFARNPETRVMGAGRDLFAMRADGIEIPVEIGLNPMERDGRRGALATVIDISERKAAERRQTVLVHEIEHRGRNLLSVVQALASRVFTSDRPLADANRLFSSVPQALGRSQELLSPVGSADLADIVRAEVVAFAGAVTTNGPNVGLTSMAAQSFALIVHELATNSMKYGALSRESGRVEVTWSTTDSELAFSWREEGGPPVQAPSRTGFGRTILEELPRDWGAAVSRNYAPAGFEFELRVNRSAVLGEIGERQRSRVA